MPTSPLFSNGTFTCASSASARAHPVTALYAAPAPRPMNTFRAWLPPASLATSTWAQAVPSGYGSRPCSRSIRKRRSGIMNSTPSSPPAMASVVICSSDGCRPHKNSAGNVKMTPLATELEAEPTVWERFASRMVAEPPNLRSA